MFADLGRIAKLLEDVVRALEGLRELPKIHKTLEEVRDLLQAQQNAKDKKVKS